MAGDFGFIPTGGPGYQVKSAGGGGADFGKLTIKEHYPLIMKEDPAALEEAGHAWRKVESLLSATRSQLRAAGNSLRTDWKSEAGDAFFDHVGATTYSFAEWSWLATQNHVALSTLAPAVWTAQTDMQLLWDEFNSKAADLKAQDKDNSSIGERLRDVGDWSGNRLEDLLKEYTHRSMNEVVEPLANAYAFATSQLGNAAAFRGPKNAAKPSQGAFAAALGGAPGAPGAPGGAAPAAPGGGAGAQGAPPQAPGAAARNAAIKARNDKIKARNAIIKARNAKIKARNAKIKAKNKIIKARNAIIKAQNAIIKAQNAVIAAQNSAITALNAQIAAQNDAIAAHNAEIGALNSQIAGLDARLATTPAAPPTFAGPSRGAAPQPPAIPPGAMSMPGAPLVGDGPGVGGPVLPSGLNGSGAPPAPPGAAPPGTAQGSRGGPSIPPGLQGRSGGPGAPPGSPARPGSAPPTLPGRGGRPGSAPRLPAEPEPGSPGAPALPGRGGARSAPGFPGNSRSLPGSELPLGRPGRGVPASPNGTGAPRSLQGIRGRGALGRPFDEPRIPSPLGLDGRLQSGPIGSPETSETMRQALRRGLAGRELAEAGQGAGPSLGSSGRPGAGSLSPTPNRPRSRPDEDRQSADAYLDRVEVERVGDDDLFTHDQRAPAVIEPPEYRGPVKRAGPALGVNH